MKILISGSSGLVGQAWMAHAQQEGYQITRLVRKPSSEPNTLLWDPLASKTATSFESWPAFDVVIHLAGDSVAEGRWTSAKKKRIVESRIQGTRTLCGHLRHNPPKLLLSASAIGIYGDRGDTILDDSATPGSGFLAETAIAWEDEAMKLASEETRVVPLRFGIILSKKGGAFPKMHRAFQWGVGGRLGSGKQIMSWILLDDVIRAMEHIIHVPTLTGPINMTAPNPVSNLEWTYTLGKIMQRPTFLPAPAWALQFVLGEMAQELLLASTCAVPNKLEDADFHFEHYTLKHALKHLLTD